MQDKQTALAEAIHEVADIAVNFGGYAEDHDEANARAAKRDKLESDLHSFIEPKATAGRNPDHFAVWYTPDAIRDVYEDLAEDGDERAGWVKTATDEQLWQVSESIMGSDALWRMFHETLDEAVDATIETAASC